MFNEEGYPMSNERDGIDTSKHSEGYVKNALKIHGDHRTWTNSKTGMPTEAPDYAKED